MSLREKHSSHTQKETISWTSAGETAITLDRGTKWSIKKISVYAANAQPDAYVQVLRKNSATTANERDSSHSDSKGVLFGEFYLSTTTTWEHPSYDDFGDKGLRLYIDLGTGASSDTVYLTIDYDYQD